jgi:peptide-methionine (S)-S-oxide reductase
MPMSPMPRLSSLVAATVAAAIALLLALSLMPTALGQGTTPTAPAPAGLAKATFAGGCFWCMEPPFEKLAGVKSVVSGYTGGRTEAPTYRQIGSGDTGHAEAVEVVYDPAVVSYDELLAVFWANIDPTVADRQFCDIGSQYRSAIFVHDAAQREAAEAGKARWQADARFAGKTIHTEIVDAAPFWLAEDYHQDYAAKNPARYEYYRWGCGRDARLAQVWGEAPAH